MGGIEELKNVMIYSVKKPYLPVRSCKLLHFMGISIGQRMEIRETSGLPIPMVPRLHQSNGHIKRNESIVVSFPSSFVGFGVDGRCKVNPR